MNHEHYPLPEVLVYRGTYAAAVLILIVLLRMAIRAQLRVHFGAPRRGRRILFVDYRPVVSLEALLVKPG